MEITPALAGCWLDGSQGWHNSYRVIHLAQDYGFYLDDYGRSYVALWILWRGHKMPARQARRFERRHGFESMDAIVQEATEYLASKAPEGYAFEWDMGEFGLYSLCQIEGTEEYDEHLKSGQPCEYCEEPAQ